MHGLNVLRGTGPVSDVRATAVERWRVRVRPVLRCFSSALSPELDSSNTLVCVRDVFAKSQRAQNTSDMSVHMPGSDHPIL